METRKVLSGLSYLSVLFAGFIFPLIVFFAAEDDEVKKHAKKAFLSHLIPLIPVPLIILGIIFDVTGRGGDTPFFAIVGIVLTIVVSLVVVIWNLIKGIKILVEK